MQKFAANFGCELLPRTFAVKYNKLVFTGGAAALQTLRLGSEAPPPQTPLNWSAAVVASKGQEGPTVIALVGRCRGLRRPVFGVMSKISQDQHV